MATLYSNCNILALNCSLYIDPILSSLVSAGFHSNGSNCYETDSLGKIIAITPCTVPCDLAVTGGITSTDPTILGGTDGTITINFTTSNGPSTYTVNGGPSGPAVSPLVITGLSSFVEYFVEITDSANCTVNATITLGQTAIRFDADWIMVSYEFTDGSDLDTRTRIAIPDIGQDTQPEYIGWSCLPTYPTTDIPILTWGYDNTGTGFESVLIDVIRFKQLYPVATEFIVDLRGFWFGSQGFNPVNAGVTLWKGGTPVKNGCGSYCWTNPTAAFTNTIDSVPKVVTLKPTSNKGLSPGERVATMKYNLATYVTILDNADNTTPSV
jgi:hypothetical protein